MTINKKPRFEEVSPLPLAQSIMTAFTTHGLVPQKVGKQWFGGFLQSTSEEVLKKCTLLIQNVLVQLNALAGITSVKLQETYTVSDFENVKKRVCQVYREYVKVQLQKCLTTDVKLLQLQTFQPLEFPLGIKPNPSSPVAKLTGFVDFVVAAEALFSNENKEMAIELTLQLWEQISEVNQTHHLIKKAFSSLQEIFKDPRLPVLKVESYMKTAFDEGRIALGKIARMDSEKNVMEAEVRNLTSSFFKWKIRPPEKEDSPRWVTPRLLDECESCGKAGFFSEDQAQKLIIGAFHKAWHQDFHGFKPNWIILRHIWTRWETWAKLTLKPDQTGLETFLLNFDAGKFVLGGVDFWILQEVSPFFRLLFKNQFREGIANEASLHEVSEAEFRLFYDAILRDPKSPLQVITVPAPSAALDERLVVLRLAQRFQCMSLSETYFKSFKIDDANVDELFEFEERLIKQECLDTTTATYWTPIRAAYLETTLMPKFTIAQAVDFLNHNFKVATLLNLPAFLLKTFIVNLDDSEVEDVKELKDCEVKALRSSIELYSNSLETLIFEVGAPTLPLLTGLKIAHLKNLTVDNSTNTDIENVCSRVIKYQELNNLTLIYYSDLSRWLPLIYQLPHLTHLTVKESVFEEDFLESFGSLPKKIHLTITMTDVTDDNVELLFSSIDFWKTFLGFNVVKIEFLRTTFSETLQAGFEEMTFDQTQKSIIFKGFKGKNNEHTHNFFKQIKEKTNIFFIWCAS